jgi:hypothetical protein
MIALLARARVVLLAPFLASHVAVAAQDPLQDPPAADEEVDLFHDEKDGAFDASQFLSSKIGFLPVLIPITEPAVGYGLGGGLAFLHTRPRVVDTPDGLRVVPPDATFVGGMATENGTWGGFGAHLHTWQGGRIRYMVGGGYASLNLDWFGQSDAFAGRPFSYNLEASALVQKLSFKLGDSDFFAGVRQRALLTDTRFDPRTDLTPTATPPDLNRDQLDADVSGLGLTVGYDTRDSYFSPTRGTKASADWIQNADAFGSDFDYGRLELESCTYVPLREAWTLGLRGEADYAGEDAPFFDLAAIHLRGIEAGRYVDNFAVTVEAEVRWDVSARWTVVGFGGVGWVADEMDLVGDAKGRGAGGAGFRYLLAREYDLRLGLDAAVGPDQGAVYVTVGTGWLRD